MADLFIAPAFILFLLGGWILIQHLARRFAARHPEFGPAKEEGSGCGHSCQCSSGSCQKRSDEENPTHQHNTQ